MAINEDQGARLVLKYVIGLKNIINYSISREDKTNKMKDKTSAKSIKMSV